MADLINTPDDDVFKKFVESKKQKEEALKAKSSGDFSGEYKGEAIKYVAADKGGHAIVRFVGAPPSDDGRPGQNTYDAIERHISQVKDDKGKKMYLILPLRTDTLANDHIIWRIVSDVKKKEYVNKKPVFVNQINHPDIFEIVAKGNFKPTDGNSYKFSAGWDAPKMLLINCIDRLDSWCKDNKHTKVFSRNIWINDQGAEYPDWGVKSNGFLTKLTSNLGKYGSWSKYDSYIVRTGQKDDPWHILNASGFKASGMTSELEGATAAEIELISTDPSLTEEEKYYQTYNLEENFKISSYQKILTRLGGQIKQIDSALGTRYYDELVALAAQEKKEREIEKEAKKALEAEAVGKIPASPSISESKDEEPVVTSEPVRRVVPETSAPTTEGLSPEKITALKGWSELTDGEKSLIKDVVFNADGTVNKVIYDDSCGNLYPCPTDQGGCGADSPESYHCCPVCGKRWA